MKSKCGIYDIPPSHKTTTTNSTAPLSTTANYDIVPPPRKVEENSVYDTPPKPKLVKTPKLADASPRCKADYNMPLKYVDLSQYDGNENDSHSYMNLNSASISLRNSYNRSKSCDTSSNYDTPPPTKGGRQASSSVPLYDNIKLHTVTSYDVIPRKPSVTHALSNKNTPTASEREIGRAHV